MKEDGTDFGKADPLCGGKNVKYFMAKNYLAIPYLAIPDSNAPSESAFSVANNISNKRYMAFAPK